MVESNNSNKRNKNKLHGANYMEQMCAGETSREIIKFKETDVFRWVWLLEKSFTEVAASWENRVTFIFKWNTQKIGNFDSEKITRKKTLKNPLLPPVCFWCSNQPNTAANGSHATFPHFQLCTRFFKCFESGLKLLNWPLKSTENVLFDICFPTSAFWC